MLSKNIIKKIVKATKVKSGELILLHFWGEDSDREVLNDFIVSVTALGATPVVLQQSRTLNKEIFMNAKESCFNEKYFKMFENIDAVLDIFMYQPVILGAKIDEDKMNLYREYMRNLFGVLMQNKRFTQIRIPTVENSKESNLSEDEFVKRMVQAYDINYDELKSKCEEKIKKIGASKSAKVITNKNCELNLEFEDRKWLVDDGDGDMPCGEVYIAPIEEKTNGSLYYSKIFIEDVGEFYDVTLNINKGKLTDSNNENINEFLKSLSDDDKVVCEFGIGMNSNVKELCGYTVLDEKADNTFHIAIGNNTMFGGKNNANVHIDFVGAGNIIFN